MKAVTSPMTSVGLVSLNTSWRASGILVLDERRRPRAARSRPRAVDRHQLVRARRGPTSAAAPPSDPPASMAGDHRRHGIDGRQLERPVPDQRVVGVGRDPRRRPATARRRRSAGRGRRRRRRSSRAGRTRPMTGPDRTHGHQLVGVELGVAGGDHPSHRVADEDHRQIRPRARPSPRSGVEVGDDVVEVVDDHAIAAALAVADVVGPVRRRHRGRRGRRRRARSGRCARRNRGRAGRRSAVRGRGRATTARRSGHSCR